MPEIRTRDRGRFEGLGGTVDGKKIVYKYRTEEEVWAWWDENEERYLKNRAEDRERDEYYRLRREQQLREYYETPTR